MLQPACPDAHRPSPPCLSPAILQDMHTGETLFFVQNPPHPSPHNKHKRLPLPNIVPSSPSPPTQSTNCILKLNPAFSLLSDSILELLCESLRGQATQSGEPGSRQPASQLQITPLWVQWSQQSPWMFVADRHCGACSRVLPGACYGVMVGTQGPCGARVGVQV